jgi:hypothetical protein
MSQKTQQTNELSDKALGNLTAIEDEIETSSMIEAAFYSRSVQD